MNVAHMIASSIVHGLVYGTIYKAIRHLSLAQTAIVAAAGIAIVWALSYLLPAAMKRDEHCR